MVGGRLQCRVKLSFVNSQRMKTVRVYNVFASLASRPFGFVWPWV